MSEGPSSMGGRLARALLIVPAAHYRVLDEGFQAEMYELFHTRAGCRLGHMVCTPVAVLGLLLALGCSTGIAWSWAPPAALALAIVAWGLRVDRLAGAVTALLVAVTLAAAHRLASTAAHPVALGAALAVGAAVVQVFSHGFEDIPPPLSGGDGWVPLRAWLAAASPARVAGLGALSLAVFTWLELWASPRVWPLQVLHLLMRAGHRPELRASLSARVEEIFVHPGAAWHQPITHAEAPRPTALAPGR